jgi:hypothetical protein
MGAAQMENQRVAFALENKTQIKAAPALHEGRDAPKSDSRVKVWLTE